MERHQLTHLPVSDRKPAVIVDRRAAALVTCLALFGGTPPARSQNDPYSIGMQYCQMVNNGIDRKKAWDYTVSSFANTSQYGVNNLFSGTDRFAPWSPTRTIPGALGSGIGAGIASGIAVGMELRRMKVDIQTVINQNCPGDESRPDSGASVKAPPNKNSTEWEDFCFRNPWLKECGGQNPNKTTCPGCGVNEVNFPAKDTIPPQQKEESRPTVPVHQQQTVSGSDEQRKKAAHQKCAKVTDYAGCMKYTLSE